MDWANEVTGEAGETVVEKRYRVPVGYLEDEVERVRMLIGQIEAAGDDQTAIDEAYDKLLVMMKGGLVEMKSRRKRGQPWFTREIAKLRKVANGAEREWLRCSDKVEKKGKRREYVEKRRVYKRAVGKAKRKFEESRRNELENMMRNPRRWWKMVKKLGMTGGRERSDIGKVYDEVGVVRQGKEAVEVWRKYFEKVLNDGGRLGAQDEVESEKASDGNELMSECLTIEEVEQALGSLKKKSAPGSNGLTAEMVCCNMLVDFWYSLFNWCWRYGRVPSEWKKV